MKHITFYFDVVSPYAYLAFEALPQALQGHSVRVSYRPVLFAGLLKHHGQLGPAEMAGKRIWTYRQVLWLARQHGVALRMPRQHPFNPLGLLRLALRCARDGAPNRLVCETLFRAVWQSGAEAGSAAMLEELSLKLSACAQTSAEQAKADLHANTQAAIAEGVFGVPTMQVDGQLFWGLDALPMLREYLQNPTELEQHSVQASSVLPYQR